jgi:D-alanyl-lipoteichoic acid acyltransferase DltB (MBOAT superfamily)
MLFNSLEYLFIFLPCILILYFLLNNLKKYDCAKISLLLASFFFYSYFKTDYLKIILFSICFNYFISLIIIEKIKFYKLNKKFFLFVALTGNLLLLCYFKYWNFLIVCFNNISHNHFNTLELLLPLGISFFTFQQISYIVDCYKGDAKYTNIIDYSLFVTFFPQLIAGPIVHHKEIIPQFENKNNKYFNTQNFLMGCCLITIGLVKKILLADAFIPFIDSSINNLSNIDILNSWFLALSIGSQGYFDFSGYCDIALGSAYMFNIILPINFSSPYKSIDISDYWRRWHITLGRFLKYNVYIPLGGSRTGTFNTYRNLMTVFILTGIWHGANWPCLSYGFINGCLVCCNKFWKTLNIEINKYLSITITFITMIFISPLVLIKTIHQCIKVWSTMLGINTFFVLPQIIDNNFIFYNKSKISIFLIPITLFILFALPNSNQIAEKYIKSNNYIYTIILVFIFIYTTLNITTPKEYIYFQF